MVDMQRDAPEDYRKSLDHLRFEKDAFFRDDSDSPIPLRERGGFRGLNYYPPTVKYRLPLRLTKHANPEKVTLATSKGVPRAMVRYGFFDFEIDGVRQRLSAYMAVPEHGHVHERSLFVPFRDATSGKETYGAGRYLDLPETADDAYLLDFNLAYNPWCVYSEDYVCPFPPPENWLTAPIRAGEKAFP